MYQRGTNHRSSLPDVDDIIARYRYRLAEESIFSQLEHLEGKHFPITLTPLGWEAMEAAAFCKSIPVDGNARTIFCKSLFRISSHVASGAAKEARLTHYDLPKSTKSSIETEKKSPP